MSVELPVLTAKDFASDQELRWCPRCGDYSILAQMKKVLPTLGIPKEKFVFVSGIGCSSRFPYYMDTYGFHSIHGRAPAIASGVKLCQPDLQVWVITGDGDALSIGGNHLIHAIRRNIDLNIVLFNNRIYGLTKGQYSPTSLRGAKTKSTPVGSIDNPLTPLCVAIGAEASFVARSVDVDIKHLAMVLDRAAHHKGTSFVEVYQDCNVFNSGAFDYASKKGTKEENVVYLEHGKPLIFGKEKDKGIRVNTMSQPEVVTLGNGVAEDDLLFHDEKAQEPNLAFLLARMHHPEFPEPMGIFRDVDRPIYDEDLEAQMQQSIADHGEGDLDALFNSGDTWTVGEDESAEALQPVAVDDEPDNGDGASTITCDASGLPLAQFDISEDDLEESITRHPIGALMPREPHTVPSTTSVREAIDEMNRAKVGCLLVEDDGELVGVFTERDVLNKGSDDPGALDRPVSELMTYSPETLRKNDSIAFAMHTMDLGGYRHLPIVAEDGHPTGVISSRDILRFLCIRFAELRSKS